MSVFGIFKPIQRRVRLFFRQRMMPLTVDEAEEKRELFAKIYFLSSFSLLTFLLYLNYRQKLRTTDHSVSLAESTIERLKIDGKIRIVKFDGTRRVEDYYYERKKENEVENQNTEPEVVDTVVNL